jgi:hypothetical protein
MNEEKALFKETPDRLPGDEALDALHRKHPLVGKADFIEYFKLRYARRAARQKIHLVKDASRPKRQRARSSASSSSSDSPTSETLTTSDTAADVAGAPAAPPSGAKRRRAARAAADAPVPAAAWAVAEVAGADTEES